MQLFSWLHKRITGRPRTRRTSALKPKRGFRPRLDGLEGRDVPSFAAPAVYPSTATIALVTGDVNGDGRPDLVYANNNGDEIVVQLGNRNGTFDAPIFGSGGNALLGTTTAIAVGPFMGKPSIWLAHDLLEPDFANEVADFSILQLQLTNQITKTKGNKTVTTSKAVLNDVYDWFPDQNNAIPGPISSLALADLDGNGETDLIAVATRSWGFSGNVNVALSDSSGFFQTHQSYGILSANSFYGQAQGTVGDLNGDGKPDIIVTDSPLNAVAVFLNNGNGNFFGTAQIFAVGGTPAAVAVGDVSGDGKLDIVTANANGTVTVLPGLGNGSFGTAQNYAVGGAANSVVLGDFNHDGRMDIATTGGIEMDVLFSIGSGTFGAYQKVGPAGTSLVAADFNCDGYVDLGEIDASQNNIDVLLNKADW
jgi:hypothetical protein